MLIVLQCLYIVHYVFCRKKSRFYKLGLQTKEIFYAKLHEKTDIYSISYSLVVIKSY